MEKKVRKRKGFNRYEVRGDITIMFINYKGKEYESIIDTEDVDKLIEFNHHWNLLWSTNKFNNYCYVRTTVYQGWVDGVFKTDKTLKLNRFLIDVELNDFVDHINHNTLDNRKENLRISDVATNAKNRKSKNNNNTSGYRNVSKIGNLWHVQLQVDGVNTCLKKFPLNKLDEAGVYAELMRIKYYGKFAGNN